MASSMAAECLWLTEALSHCDTDPCKAFHIDATAYTLILAQDFEGSTVYR